MSIGKERKERERDICPADFYCFFSEPIFHPSPRPLLCSSEEHQELVHGNVRERNRSTDECTTDLLIRFIKITFSCKRTSWFWLRCKVKTPVLSSLAWRGCFPIIPVKRCCSRLSWREEVGVTWPTVFQICCIMFMVIFTAHCNVFTLHSCSLVVKCVHSYDVVSQTLFIPWSLTVLDSYWLEGLV